MHPAIRALGKVLRLVGISSPRMPWRSRRRRTGRLRGGGLPRWRPWRLRPRQSGGRGVRARHSGIALTAMGRLDPVMGVWNCGCCNRFRINRDWSFAAAGRKRRDSYS